MARPFTSAPEAGPSEWRPPRASKVELPGVRIGSAMIDNEAMTALIRLSFPDAEVRIVDLTGTMDHFNVFVRSGAFRGVSLMDRHRMVEGALADARADGRIHAMSIRTEVLE